MEKQDPGCVYVFQGLNTDSGNYAKPASFKVRVGAVTAAIHAHRSFP